MRQARDNNTYKAIYHVILGQYLEERAIARGEDPLESDAVGSYQRALEEELALAQSAFWDPDPIHTARQAGLAAFFEDADPGEQLLLAVYRGWEVRAAGVLDANTDSDEYLAALALGTYFRDMVGDYEAAREWFTTAIECKPKAVAYAERAETYYLLGDMANAETDARIALYRDPVLAARAYYILALVELAAGDVAPDDEQFNEWLIKGVEPRVVKEDFSQVVFLRPGFFDYLPQMNAPGRDSDHYAPWFLLAERYAADDDPETDAADVYEAILEQDPYVEAAQERLAALR
jgi:tetratricopeptide (TPR) repeat protein